MWFIASNNNNNNNNNNNKIEENIIKTTNNNNSISNNHSHNMEILIDYSDQNKTIIDILNAIAIKYKIRISLFIETEYKIAAVNFHKKSLKSILEDFQKIYDLHYRMEKDVIYIEECENQWKQYYVNNFHEENLPKDLDSIANIDNSTEKSKQVIYKPFWDQVELTIKKLTNDQYIIDKHNCIVHILGKCKTQALVKEYIDKISTLQQVEIEIKFLEITSDYNLNINPMEIIEPLLKYNNNSNSKGFSTLIGSFSNIIMSTYKNISINYSSTMKLRLLSQHTGQISVTNEINEFRVGKVKSFNLKDNNKNLIREAETLYQFTEGLSLTFVPVILENNKILLKMRPSIKKYKKNTDNEINMGNREIMTVLYGQCNELLAVGGLETTHTIQSESLLQRIPLLGRLIPKTTKKEKTQIIILLKMNIVK